MPSYSPNTPRTLASDDDIQIGHVSYLFFFFLSSDPIHLFIDVGVRRVVNDSPALSPYKWLRPISRRGPLGLVGNPKHIPKPRTEIDVRTPAVMRTLTDAGTIIEFRQPVVCARLFEFVIYSLGMVPPLSFLQGTVLRCFLHPASLPRRALQPHDHACIPPPSCPLRRRSRPFELALPEAKRAGRLR